MAQEINAAIQGAENLRSLTRHAATLISKLKDGSYEDALGITIELLRNDQSAYQQIGEDAANA